MREIPAGHPGWRPRGPSVAAVLKTSRASVQAVRAEYLAVLGAKLLHVHLSENDGTADQHLPPGSAPRSTTAWPDHIRKLKATGYDGTITLEVFSPNKEYLFASRDLLRKWWAQA